MKTNKDPRHEARRLALNTIYSENLGGTADTDYTKEVLGIKKYDQGIYTKITENYLKNIDKIREKVREGLSTWSKDQLIDLDLIIIYIAVLEFDILKITPVKVAVDEAVELSKEFGGDKSGKFVNGVLAKVIQNNTNG